MTAIHPRSFGECRQVLRAYLQNVLQGFVQFATRNCLFNVPIYAKAPVVLPMYLNRYFKQPTTPLTDPQVAPKSLQSMMRRELDHESSNLLPTHWSKVALLLQAPPV